MTPRNAISVLTLAIVAVLTLLMVMSCGPAPTHGYTLTSRSAGDARNAYRTYYDLGRCEETRQELVYRHPDVEWRCLWSRRDP